MRLLKNPVVQFLLGTAVVVTLVALASSHFSDQAARTEAVADARATTELLAGSVVEPSLPRGLVSGRAGAVDRFDRMILERVALGDVQRIKIWNRDGTIVYSDQTELIGETFELEADELAVLDGGPTNAEVSDLGRPENSLESDEQGLVEVYTRVVSPEGEPLLFEVYYSAADVTRRQDQINDAFLPIILGGVAELVLLTIPLLWVLHRRVQKAAAERERLLRAAVDASDAERRRIARDLHDGVVQDLAGTSFRIAALSRNGSGADATDVAAVGTTVRSSLRQLRSLLVEIYPPDLEARGLPGALEDLLAPVAAQGITVDQRVSGDLDDVSREHVGLVWRVAQEAVRNAVRHARPGTISVSVSREGDRVRLVVSDDGTGFDPDAAAGPGHLGLRGLRDLVGEVEGDLRIDSCPGGGTTVTLEVDA